MLLVKEMVFVIVLYFKLMPLILTIGMIGFGHLKLNLILMDALILIGIILKLILTSKWRKFLEHIHFLIQKVFFIFISVDNISYNLWWGLRVYISRENMLFSIIILTAGVIIRRKVLVLMILSTFGGF